MNDDWFHVEFVEFKDDDWVGFEERPMLGLVLWNVNNAYRVYYESADGEVRGVNPNGNFDEVREYCEDSLDAHVIPRRYRGGRRSDR